MFYETIRIIANVSFGLVGIAALFCNSFINGAALSAGLYFGLAGFAHIKAVKTHKEEVFPMVTNLLAFIVIEACLIITLLQSNP